MIHLTSEELLSPWTDSFYNEEMVYSDDLYCETCDETKSELEAYEISQDPHPNDPYGTLPGVSKDRCRYCRRHSQCTRGFRSVPWNRNPKHGPLRPVSFQSNRSMALLRVNRTVCHEAGAILCANTIFSFKLAHTLTTFPLHLSPLQRPAVKNIHLDINLDAEHDVWSWKSDDLTGTLAKLPGLRDLHLTIRQSCQGDFRAFSEALKRGSLPLWDNDLVHFRRSSLRNVTVIIEDIDSISLQNWNGNGPWMLHRRLCYLEQEGHWTMAQRAEYARILRDKLLPISPRASARTYGRLTE